MDYLRYSLQKSLQRQPKEMPVGKRRGHLFKLYCVNAWGFLPPTGRVKAIVKLPKPRTISDLKRFLGRLNYYRCCVPHAAHLQAPLCSLLRRARKRDKSEIKWTHEAEKAFSNCKTGIAAATRAIFLSPSTPLTLTTDASDTATGASLKQQEEGIWKPLGSFSRKLLPVETRYSTYDRELLAIYSALKHFKHVDGRHFIIRMDYRPLVFSLSAS